MGIRSILRRAVKPAAMALVAGTLALSLTVTTTQKAEASPIAVAPVILAAEGIVGGASIPLAMPSLLAASIALHPVGWAIGAGVAVAGLAIGAYHTRDYWLPYVTGAFGEPKPRDVNVPSSTWIKPGYRVVKASVIGGNSISADYAFTGSSSTWYSWVGAIAQCKRTSDGHLAYASSWGYGSRTNSFTWTWSPSAVLCPSGWTLQGAIIGGGVGSQAGSYTPDLAGTKNADGTFKAVTMGGGNTQYDKSPENVIKLGTWDGATSFDPKGSDVKYKTTVECVSDDGTKSTLTADWTGDNGGAKFPSCAAAGKGHGTGKNKIEGYAPTAPGVPGTVPETLWETTAPAVDPNYEKCDQGRPGSGCRMAITIDGKPCVVGQWECENWSELWKDSTTSTRVGCTYGPYTLSPDACSIMEPAYRPGGAPTTDANVDGNPQTRNNNQLDGTTYTPQQAPPAPGGAGTVPLGTKADEAACWPQGWAALNPLEWVYRPTVCAGRALFEPKKDVQTRLAGMESQFSNKVPMSWFGVGTSGVSGGGCPTDWAITVEGQRLSLICGTPVDGIVQAFRPILGAMLVIAALWPLIRSLFYSAIPVFKVNPS